VAEPLDLVRLIIAWAVVVAWLASIIVDATVPTYEPPASIHILMMLVAGALFGPRIARRGNGNSRG